ncbi:undecaprenyl-diphosphate phosphatase [Aquirhabdus parva]|uniref:Undecaprenyl-diphosphatase n=1 Tax=Aquirhabdus parva TaxID=2283318 RepID=A0A345P325_9GAMM|nr:undecaprenyl-diphosphate phosphatase [Aquirhabdus parva]AXI01684.1 undecaprenyl-diphosphate phosphatase [Aquirhabdus parva]
MDLLLLFQAFIMGIVEGLTEFLPVSSTGHLIVVGELLNFWTAEKRVVFEIAIQLGAILAICFEYRAKLIHVTAGLISRDASSIRFTRNVLVAFLPAAIIGFIAHDTIQNYLFNPLVVAFMLIFGGFVILWAERRTHQVSAEEVDDMSWLQALKVGFAQCFAMIPGTSRSGATIIGGLFFGLSRKTAAEFSFFLAIPTMLGATVLSVAKHRHEFLLADFPVIAVGFVMAFIVALLVVKALVRYVSKHDFTVFAWYRIGFGILILLTSWFGWVNWNA